MRRREFITGTAATAAMGFAQPIFAQTETRSPVIKRIAMFHPSEPPEGLSINDRPAYKAFSHRSRPFGSHVMVTSHSTGRSVTVRINDRGPFVRGRCIDLSNGAARVLGMDGTAVVSLH